MKHQIKQESMFSGLNLDAQYPQRLSPAILQFIFALSQQKPLWESA